MEGLLIVIVSRQNWSRNWFLIPDSNVYNGINSGRIKTLKNVWDNWDLETVFQLKLYGIIRRILWIK